jgi:hypothetical protein
VVDDLAQVVAALDAVLYLAEDLADLVFDRVRGRWPWLESVQVGEKLGVDEGMRSSPVSAVLWSILPSLPFGAAHASQR